MAEPKKHDLMVHGKLRKIPIRDHRMSNHLDFTSELQMRKRQIDL